MQVDFPDKLQCLFKPARYKVLYGGRGGAKSWGIARALLIHGAGSKKLIFCGREIQKSIKESVKRLLENQIEALGLKDFYEVLKDEIRGRNGTEFIFGGLRHNIDNIKSLEGADIAWIEEASNVSAGSWDKLVPTLRKDGSEIWVSFNPELEEDETYQRFVIDPPTGAIVQSINWQDNPWFPSVLRQEKDDLLRKNPSKYDNIWDGKCKQAIEGAIFANELRIAAEEQRITRVAVKPGIPVQTFWDLGQSDNTAIWFVQIVGLEYRIVDYYENSGEKVGHYVAELAKRDYLYDEHCLPHDAAHEQMAAKATIEQQLREAIRNNAKLGKSVRIVPRIPKKALGIDAARTIFAQCLFDKENTKDGLTCLRRYAYERDEDTGKIGKEPKHDIYSHGADAFLCFAQHYKRMVIKRPQPAYAAPVSFWAQ